MQNMHKEVETHGIHLPSGWLKIYVERSEETDPSWLMEIESNLLNTLKSLSSSPEADIYITQVDQLGSTIIVTYYAPKKTVEKSGQQ